MSYLKLHKLILDAMPIENPIIDPESAWLRNASGLSYRLADAIRRDFVVVPRDELPAVTECGGECRGDDTVCFGGSPDLSGIPDLEGARQLALDYIAIWQHGVTQRQNLAQLFMGEEFGGPIPESTKRAIEYIEREIQKREAAK